MDLVKPNVRKTVSSFDRNTTMTLNLIKLSDISRWGVLFSTKNGNGYIELKDVVDYKEVRKRCKIDLQNLVLVRPKKSHVTFKELFVEQNTD